MAMRLKAAVLVMMCLAPGAAMAQANEYNITLREHAACDADAYQFCNSSGDVEGLIGCMKSHRPDLSPMCRSVFEAGLKAPASEVYLHEMPI